jgi:hypothetical protein
MLVVETGETLSAEPFCSSLIIDNVGGQAKSLYRSVNSFSQ